MKRILYYICLAIGLIACDTPEKKELQRPNILFAIADDASFPHMGIYGTQWVSTPAFDKVASSGLLFNRAYTPNAKCSPSRACILTGRNSWQLEEAANHVPFFPQKYGTYMELLSERGYQVGFTGKGWAPGDPGSINGTKRQLTGKAYQEMKKEVPAAHISVIDYAANFEAFLNEHPGEDPFCFWYGGFEPHRRYEYEAGVKKGGKKIEDIDKVFEFWPDNEITRNDLLDYAFEIEYFDQQLAKMLELLEERGLLENTLIVVTADNGMPFPRIKGQKYELSNHLPLAIMWKAGIQHPGRIIDDFVSFIDFAPTFLEVAETSDKLGNMEAMTGKSLLPIFNSEKSGITGLGRDHVLLGKERHDIGRPNDWGYPVRGIVKNEYLYLHNYEPQRWPAGNPETGYLNTDGSPTKTFILEGRRKGNEANPYWKWNFGKKGEEELYNIVEDPECMHNLSDNEDYSEILDQLKAQMENELKQEADPRLLGNAQVFDQYQYAQEKMRGFYDKYLSGDMPSTGWVNKSDYEKELIEE